MKKILLALLTIAALNTNAQINPSNSSPQFSISPAFELLRSTHGNLFYSPSVKANFLFKNGWEPGFGIEYSATPFHNDNEYTLFKLRYLPIYGNLKYNFRKTKKLKPYLETSVGLSIIKYNISADITPNNISTVNEKGLYIYGGTGLKYPISKKINGFIGVGFKAYRITLNDLDINPHGLSFQAGFNIF